MSTPGVAPPSPLRALAILGSASGLTILAGVLSQKIAAVLLSPAGVGEMGLVIAYTGMIGVIAALGANTALVAKIGRAAAEGPEAPEGLAAGTADPAGLDAAGYVRAARQNVVALAVALCALAALLAPVIGEGLLGDGTSAIELIAATAAGALWAMNTVEIGILVAHHRVRATAKAAALTCFISPSVNLVMFLWLERDGIIPGALVSIALVLAVTRTVVEHELDHPRAPARGRWGLVTFGVPVTVSSFVGAATVLAIPVMTTHRLGEESTGFYRAAAVLSEGYLAIIMTTITQDFFPRVARTTHSNTAFAEAIDRQVRLVSSVVAPIALLVAVALPVLVPLLYSQEFRPAEELIRLQLPGDYFRLLSSILAAAILARLGSMVRLGAETVSLAVYAGLVAVGLATHGLNGLGIAFSVAYGLYLCLLVGVLRVGARFAPDRRVIGHIVLVAAMLTVPAVTAWLVGPAAASVAAAVLVVPATIPFLKQSEWGRTLLRRLSPR